MHFMKASIPGISTAFYAVEEPWTFLAIREADGWTTSYRLSQPTGPVSAASTIQGPFPSFEEAKRACREKLADLRRLS